MSKDAFAEGEQAASKDIPADANPYEEGTQEHARWVEGHETVAGAVEASQGEGT